MDAPSTRKSSCLCIYYQHHHSINCSSYLCHGYSCKRFCFFLILFFLVCTTLIGVITVVIIFVVKPRRPIFSLQSIKLDSFNLDTSSSSSSTTVYISSNVSLTLNAQNPNKVVGLSYGSSQLHVLYKGLPLGSVQVPRFYQPRHSKNVSVHTHVVFDRVNMSLLLTNSTTDNINDLQWKKKKKRKDESSSRINNKRSLIDKLRIVGDLSIRAHAWFITFPKIKVVLDCEISVEYYARWFIISRHQMYSIKENERVSRPTSNPSFSNKCSLAVYI